MLGSPQGWVTRDWVSSHVAYTHPGGARHREGETEGLRQRVRDRGIEREVLRQKDGEKEIETEGLRWRDRNRRIEIEG